MQESRHGWVPTAAGLLCFLIGLSDVAGILFKRLGRHLEELHEVIPGLMPETTEAAVLLVGVLLMMLSHGLARRKRRAWRAALALLAASALLRLGRGVAVYLAKGPDTGFAEFRDMVITVLLLVAMVAFRREFYAAGDPRTRWRALRTFVLMAVFDMLLGLLWLYLGRSRVVGSISFGAAVEHVFLGLIGIPGPVRFESDRAGDISYVILVALGTLTAVVSVYLLMRPAEPAPRLTAADESRVRDLLERYGDGDSLGYFALRRDKSVLWSPSGKAGVTYRVVSGVMLASGDPLGDPEAWPGAMRRFVEQAARHAWVPAVLACGERAGEVWVRESGLTALELGDEAVVDVAEFDLSGRAMRGVRQAVGRIERKGYTAEVCRACELDAGQRAQLAGEAARWRHSSTERGFSMALGRFVADEDPDCVVVTARQDGELRGFLQLAPWGKDGLSLDVMRRDTAHAENGLNEFLITQLLAHALELGVRRVSLNFAVFRSVFERGERLGAGPVIRLLRGVLLMLSRWFQIESLYRFNAKFRPDWEPRYLLYPAGRTLPRVLLAALEAEAFIVWPRRHFRWLRPF
ncbi:MAG TPA: phosphatidylglycerol lysyltransferase domain-containing protein [Streptosporangiales bacterium]